jgi:hypothetical protein
MKVRRVVGTILLVSVLAFPQSNSAATNKPGASTGTAIGNAISAAISAAFPGISSIVNAIWPKNDNGKKTKDNAAASTKPLQLDANKGLQDIDKISNDLDTVTLFLANTVVAENNVVAMRTMLRGKATLNPAEKLQLQNLWFVVKDRLTRLAPAGPNISKLNDASLQATLRTVVDTNAGLFEIIKNDMDAAGGIGLADLNSNLETLDSQLSAVNALSGEIIGNVSLGLKTARQQASGAQGAIDSKAQKTALADLQKVFEERFPGLH